MLETPRAMKILLAGSGACGRRSVFVDWWIGLLKEEHDRTQSRI